MVTVSALAKPTGLAITPNPSTNGNVTLQWTASSGASSYKIYRGAVNITNVTGMTPIATGITTTTYIDHGLTNGTYYYVVVATDASVDSAISNCASVIIAISSGPGAGPGIGGYDVGLLLVAVMLGAVVIQRINRKRSLK